MEEHRNSLVADGAEHAVPNDNGHGAGTDEEQSLKKSKKEAVINIKSWVAFMSFIAIFLATDQMLRYSVLTTLEKRFGFTSVLNGIIVSSYDMGHVVLLLVLSYAGHKIHRPRMCAAGGFMSAVSGLLWAMPHFIFGPGTKPPVTSIEDANNVTETFLDYGICVRNYTNVPLDCEALYAGGLNDTVTGEGQSAEMIVSFVFLFISQGLLGAGFAPFLTVAITYLDDNTDPASSAIGVSIFLSVASLGPVMGFLFGGLMTSLYVDLSSTYLTPNDPEWVGAWWLGSLILAVIMTVFSTPLLFFPRSIKQKGDRVGGPPDKKKGESASSMAVRRRAASSFSGDEDGQPTRYEKMRTVLQRQVSEVSFESFKEEKVKSKSLLMNPVFICVTLAMCCNQYVMAGLTPFIPKFLETQFDVDAFIANIITSIITALAAGAGTFVGGYIAAEKELKPLGSARLIIVGFCLGIICFIGAMFMGCPQPAVGGIVNDAGIITPAVMCNTNCSCSGADLLPVCGSDGVNYYSACYAGCETIVSTDKQTESMVFANCSCIPEPSSSQIYGGGAVSGPCDASCVMLIPYAIIMFVCVFCIMLGGSPIMAVLIRCVDENQKSLAMGINNIATSILSSIPGPMFYGRMIDSTCNLKMPGCDESSSCLLYDNQQFRYLLHGITNGFIVLATIFMVIAHQKLRKMDFSYLDNVEDNEAPVEEMSMLEQKTKA